MTPAGWLKRSKHLRLIVRRAVATLQAGVFRSIFKGTGLAFEEVRQYEPGDDVRSIDWNVTARMGQPFVKRFVEERELRILFVLDLSGSQYCGSQYRLKHDMAAELMALLCLAGLRYGDSLGLVTFSNQIESYIPPRRGLRHALKLMHQALYLEPAEEGTSISKALQFTAKMSKRRSVIVVLSDFLDKGWEQSLAKLAHRHDVYVLQTGDPLDRLVPHMGLTQVMDAESGDRRLIDITRCSTFPAAGSHVADNVVRWIRFTTEGKHAETLLANLTARRRGQR
jgi:uncharacterized protein (DUF58 family)